MEDKNFSSLSLSKEMIDNLSELGFKEMSDIQAQSLPSILEGKDVLAQAKTGSGKTAAFGIGLLSKLRVKHYRVQSLILCPTRELADQVAKELRRIARFAHNIKILTLCGGVPFGPQLGSLKHEAHIIVGTPGRVLKHLEKGSLKFDDLDTLVLDEADRMLDMGFIEEIEKVIAFTPTERQTLLFSATYPKGINTLSSGIQREAVNIKTVSTESANKITERFYEVENIDKNDALVKVLSNYERANAIVFTNWKSEAKDIASALRESGIDSLAIHGDLEQVQRTDVLTQFANKSCSVLVATDVAARGIDIKELGLVVNYDLPKDIATYTHRIGRTGRAGEEGLAFTFYKSEQDYEMDEYKNDTRLFEEISALKAKSGFTMKPPFVSIIIEGGKKDKVRAGDILGALTGDAGIEGKYVGKIDIFDRQAFVAIAREKVQEAYKQLKRGKIKGRIFSLWIME